MGVLRDLWQRRATTFQSVWGADQDWAGRDTWAGTRVNRDAALGLSAVFACVRLLADTVATLPLRAYRRGDETREPLVPQPAWIARPIPRDPSVTRTVHFQQVLTSLLLEGNSFTLASPSVAEPTELRVLDPRNVYVSRETDGSVAYDVRDHRDQIMGRFDWTRIVHVPLLRLPGELRGISPLEAARQGLGLSIAADEFGARFFGQGAILSGVIEMPPGVSTTKDQAKEMVEKMALAHSGPHKAWRPGMLTHGATWKPLSITNEQAQFLGLREFQLEENCRFYRVPPYLIGSQKPGAVAYASVAQRAVDFEKHTIRPLIELIEPAYDLLLPPGQYLQFDTRGLMRGDPKERAEYLGAALDKKWMKRNEVRALEDLAPFPEAEGGFLETPNNNPPL